MRRFAHTRSLIMSRRRKIAQSIRIMRMSLITSIRRRKIAPSIRIMRMMMMMMMMLLSFVPFSHGTRRRGVKS
jgi:hypothetical protein